MKYIDLFAGCGGLSLGLEKAGFELVFAVEKSPMAAETFFHNFIRRIRTNSEWKSYLSKPIEEQFSQKLIVNEVREVLNNHYIMDSLESEGIDLIAGGPPCQGFSMAGRRDPSDIRNLLPWQFLEMVERIHPKAVLIENVLGIKQNFNKHGEKAPIEQINTVLRDLWPGYVTQLIEVNAMHFGVPQHRPRVMVLGLRSDIAEKLDITTWDGFWKSSFDIDPSSTKRQRPTLAPLATFNKPRTVRDALWDFKNGKYSLPSNDKRYEDSASEYARMMRVDRSWMTDAIVSDNSVNVPHNQSLRKHAEHIEARFRLYQIFNQFGVPVKIFNFAADDSITLPEKKRLLCAELAKIELPAKAPDGKILAKTIDDLFEQVMRLTTKKHSQRPLKWDMPSPTVLSLPDDFVHPHEPRTMTVREMARLQSFPDSFVFRAKETTGSLRRRFEVPQYTQVGNAVPPLLAESVGKKIYELLTKAKIFSLKNYRVAEQKDKKAS
jgi:DNA (cytosine-5)-methyltransferase 1